MQTIQSISQSKSGKFLAVFGLLILYIVLFKPLLDSAGPTGAALIALPVLLTGWYFGDKLGLIAGFVGIILNTTLLSIFTNESWMTWFINGWPGNLMAVGSGYLAGRLHKEFAEQVSIRSELKFRERFISLLSLASRDILDPKLPDDLYYYLANHLANLFVADYAYITRWDAVRGQMTLLVSTKTGSPFLDIALDADKKGPTALLLKAGQAIAIGPHVKEPYIDLNTITHLSLPENSELAIPLLVGNYKFGVVVLGFEAAKKLAGEAIVFAELVSSQIAIMLWTAEKDNQIKRQLQEATALARIEQVLSATEQVGIETVLQLIVNSAKELIPEAEHVVLHMLDGERQFLIPRAVAGRKNRTTTTLNMRLGEGVAGQVISTGNSTYVSDVWKDPRFIHQTTPVKYRSLIVAPIKKSPEDVVGTISIDSGMADVFTTDDSRLLDELGVQAAIAIENADLLETTRQDLREINALYQVSRGLAATLDPDQLMKDVTGLLQNIFEYYHVQVFVADPENGDLVVRQASGENAAKIMEKGYRRSIGSGIVGHVAEFGEPFVTNNVEAIVFFERNPLLPDTQSQLAVPIKIDNRVLGVLDIQERLPRQISQRQMKLMVAVADHLAVVLQKANLHKELQASLRQEQATRAQLVQAEKLTLAGRLLASVSHELNNPIQAIQNALFLLKEEKGISTQGKQDLEIVLSETERMATMLERLRATYQPARWEEFQPVQINTLVEDTFALVATHLRHSCISYEFLADPNLPPIPGIENQLKQVILNLVLNAVDAMPGGGHMIMATQFLQPEAEALIKVTDTGTGIDTVIIPHIFEAFVTNREQGTGLGLAISYEIITKHGGRITGENNPEGGATFSVWLPANNAGGA